jgi:hypothetical protein
MSVVDMASKRPLFGISTWNNLIEHESRVIELLTTADIKKTCSDGIHAIVLDEYCLRRTLS